MTNHVIPDAAVEAAAMELYFDDVSTEFPGEFLETKEACINAARQALKAATPHMMAPRAITTRTEVEALGEGAVVADSAGDVAEKRGGVWCSYETAPMSDSRMSKYLPATVLRDGEVSK